MKTNTIELYQYHELSDEAKERAKDWYLSVSDFDFSWECMQEDAKNVGLILESWEAYRYCKMSYDLSPKEVVKLIKENHGESCDTYKTACEYENLLTYINEDGDEVEDEDKENDFLHALEEDYRVMLDKDYEYTQSDKYISETMESNEYTFLENGERFD